MISEKYDKNLRKVNLQKMIHQQQEIQKVIEAKEAQAQEALDKLLQETKIDANKQEPERKPSETVSCVRCGKANSRDASRTKSDRDSLLSSRERAICHRDTMTNTGKIITNITTVNY